MSRARWSRSADSGKSKLKLLYPDEMPLLEKIRTIAKEIYRAKDISADKSVRDQLAAFEAMGYGKFPVCIAKTQYSFSTNPGCQGRADRPRHPGARGAAFRRRRVRGGDLRRDHDHAGPAEGPGRRLASTSARTARSWGCSEATCPERRPLSLTSSGRRRIYVMARCELFSENFHLFAPCG